MSQAWSLQLAKEGYAKTIDAAMMQSVMGLAMDQLADRLLDFIPASQRPAVARRCEVFENQYLSRYPGTLYPQAEAVLKQLKEAGYILAVVSNCQTGYIEAFFEGSGLGKYFADQESYGRTRQPKSENIKMVAARNALDWACYVGDTPMDAAAAEMAGIPFIHAAYGFGKLENAAAIQCLDQLPLAVQKLRAQSIPAGASSSSSDPTASAAAADTAAAAPAK